MTLQQYIESISRVFPDKGQTEITADLNMVLRDFCDRARIIRGLINIDAELLAANHVTITIPTGADITIDTNPPINGSGYFSFDFPTYTVDGVEIVLLWNVHSYDSDGKELSDMVSWTVIDNEIRVYNNVDSNSTDMPTGVDEIKFDCVLYAAPLSALGDIPAIPTEFHRALEAKVMSMYYRRLPIVAMPQAYGPMLAMAKTFENEYEEGVFKARKMFNINRNLGSVVS